MGLLDVIGIGKVDSKYVMVIETLNEKNCKGNGMHPYRDKLDTHKEEKKFERTKMIKLSEGESKWEHYFYDKLRNEYFYA